MRRNLAIISLAIGLLLGSGSPARAAVLTLTDSSLSFLLPFIDTGCNDPFL